MSPEVLSTVFEAVFIPSYPNVSPCALCSAMPRQVLITELFAHVCYKCTPNGFKRTMRRVVKKPYKRYLITVLRDRGIANPSAKQIALLRSAFGSMEIWHYLHTIVSREHGSEEAIAATVLVHGSEEIIATAARVHGDFRYSSLLEARTKLRFAMQPRDLIQVFDLEFALDDRLYVRGRHAAGQRRRFPGDGGM